MKNTGGPPAEEASALLFQPAREGFPSLWQNIAKLGSAVGELQNGHYFGKGPSVTSLIRQVLNGSRPYNDDLLTDIIMVTETRIHDTGLEFDSDFVPRLTKAIRTISHRRERRLNDKFGFSDHLISAMKIAKLRFAINPPLGEIRGALSINMRTGRILVERLGLLDENAPPSCVYKVCFATETDAIEFWRILYSELTEGGGDASEQIVDSEVAADRLEKIDREDHLQIYQVPYFLCLVSAAIYNPHQKETCAGMLLQQVDLGVSEPFEIRPSDIGYWRQVYYDLERGVFDPYKRLEFESFRKLVMTR